MYGRQNMIDADCTRNIILKGNSVLFVAPSDHAPQFPSNRPNSIHSCHERLSKARKGSRNTYIESKSRRTKKKRIWIHLTLSDGDTPSPPPYPPTYSQSSPGRYPQGSRQTCQHLADPQECRRSRSPLFRAVASGT